MAPVNKELADTGLQAHFVWSDAAPDPFAAAALYDGVRFRRVLAYCIDFLIICALIAAAWLIGSIFVVLTLGLLLGPLGVFTAILPLLYHTLLIGGERSATFGMRAMDIKVRAWNGNAPSMAQAALMTVMFYASLIFTNFLILLVALFNPRGRCLHDYLSGTVVVNDLD